MSKRSPIFDLRFWLMIFAVVVAEPAQAETMINPTSRVRRDEQLLALSQRANFSPSQVTLLAQESNNLEVIKITGVKLNLNQQALEVILETTGSDKLQPVTQSDGNTFIADIPNTQLVLPTGDEFRQENPASGITNLSVTNIDNNTIRVTVAGAAGLPTVELFDSDEGLIFALTAAATAMQPEQPTSEAPLEEPAAQGDEPIELIVTGQQDGYRVPNASVGTRTDTALRDIPQSIQVVPGQVIREQRTTNLIEALQNVPGVSQANQSTRGLFSLFSIRGFNASNNILRDGLLDQGFSGFVYDSSWIEQIEVLRGPASVLFGSGSLGGTVNLISKKPLNEPFYAVEGLVGNFDYYRGTVDLSAPLNSEATVLGRLNVAVESNGTFVDLFDTQRYVVTPALTWKISDRATLNFNAQYFRVEKPFDTGLPARGTVLPNPNGEIPRNRFLGDFESSDKSSAYRIGFDLDYKFNDDWQLRSAFASSSRRLDRLQYFTLALQPDNRTMTRGYVPQDFRDDLYNFDTYVSGEFTTGSVQHKLVTGVNISRLDSLSVFSFGTASPIDIFNPVYNQPLGSSEPAGDSSSRIDVLGIYLQDQIAFSDNLKLVLGGRFDIANFNQTDRLDGTTASQQYEAFSPRIGLVYQPIEPLSLYANFSQSFQVTADAFTTNPTPKPEFGTQYEVGVKADITDRLAATLALYDLSRTNIPTPDPDNPALTLLVGEQRSRGIDFNITGEVLPGWNIIMGYALTDARIARDNVFAVGNFINTVPLHTFNLWSTYEIQEGSVKGLGFGLGLLYVGEKQGDLANTFKIPSYFRTDASIFYNQGQFRAALNFRNLLNIDYFESATSINRVFPGTPFTVIGSLSWQF